MDLNSAIQKHAAWKFKFRSAILNGEHLDDASISKDDQCELGKWLHSQAGAYAQKPALAKCASAHAEFHRLASCIAGAINDKRKDEAEKMLAYDSAFSRASTEVCVAIVELQTSIR
jgi:hypothetical protein